MIESTNFIILILFLSCTFFVQFYYYDFDLFEPSIVLNATMLTSVILAYLCMEKWLYNISYITVLTIVFGYLAAFIGSYISDRFTFVNKTRNNEISYHSHYKMLTSLILIMSYMIYCSFKEVLDLSIQLGNTNGIYGMIGTVRYALERHEIVFPTRWMTYRFLLAQTIAYSYAYIFLHILLNYRFKAENLLYLIPVGLFIPFIVFTTGRIALINCLIFVLHVFVILSKRTHGNDLTSNIQTNFYMVFFAVGFIMLFFAFGSFTGKVLSSSRTPLVILGHYAGLSIPALDKLLNSLVYDNPFIGSNTLINFYRVMEKFGVEVPKVEYFLPFVKFHNIDTNVYTALGRYVLDYGFIGMILIMLFIGMVYKIAYKYTLSDRKHISIILYSTLCFPLFLSSIDERFLMDICGMPLVYTVFLFLMSNKFIISKYIVYK